MPPAASGRKPTPRLNSALGIAAVVRPGRRSAAVNIVVNQPPQTSPDRAACAPGFYPALAAWRSMCRLEAQRRSGRSCHGRGCTGHRSAARRASPAAGDRHRAPGAHDARRARACSARCWRCSTGRPTCCCRASARGAPAVAAASAHTLKGSAVGIGAFRVARAAEAVEQARAGSRSRGGRRDRYAGRGRSTRPRPRSPACCGRPEQRRDSWPLH